MSKLNYNFFFIRYRLKSQQLLLQGLTRISSTNSNCFLMGGSVREEGSSYNNIYRRSNDVLSFLIVAVIISRVLVPFDEIFLLIFFFCVCVYWNSSSSCPYCLRKRLIQQQCSTLRISIDNLIIIRSKLNFLWFVYLFSFLNVKFNIYTTFASFFIVY